jgi:hypothetical protein
MSKSLNSTYLKISILLMMFLVAACGGGGNSVEVLSPLVKDLDFSIPAVISMLTFVVN